MYFQWGRFFNKWGLHIALFVVGSIILWGIFLAPGRVPDEAKKKTVGNMARPTK